MINSYNKQKVMNLNTAFTPIIVSLLPLDNDFGGLDSISTTIFYLFYGSWIMIRHIPLTIHHRNNLHLRKEDW